MENWNPTYTVHLAPDFPVNIPLMDIGDGFFIYSFDMTGETAWNNAAAKELASKLRNYRFDGIVTVQTKSCGLAQALSSMLGFSQYLEVRKSRKPFMKEPIGVTVESITTHGKQELWIGKEKYASFVGKNLCFLDDVISTGGTIEAMLKLAKKTGFNISVIACALTEGGERLSYQGIPLISLDNIPLPGAIH